MMNTQNRLSNRQNGIALIVFAIGLVVIIGIAGLALEVSHAMLDDARIQNGLDACALSGAEALMNETGDGTKKRDAALIAIDETLDEFDSDNAGKLASLNWKSDQGDFNGDIKITFSANLTYGFSQTEDSPRFVRCEATDYSIKTRLARIFNIDTLGLQVSAVAGPLFVDICNPMPFHVCGNCGADGCDREDDCAAGGTECYGFDVYQTDGSPNAEEECYLKNCTGNQCTGETGTKCGTQVGDPDQSGNTEANEDTGAGNFGYLRVGGEDGPNQGSNFLADVITSGGGALEGGCAADGAVLPSMPGGSTKLVKAFNTIFEGPSNQFSDALPADSDTTEGPYSGYEGNGRRVLGVVIAEPYIDEDGKQTCDDQGGTHDVSVLTVGCFFATRPAVEKGSQSVIWGQFIGQCSGNGNITETPDAFDTFKIVLYKDYQAPDS